MVFKHGMWGTKLYGVWKDMIRRCENPNHKAYKNYGGRGINVCPEWRKDCVAFIRWALESGYQENLTIDRIDNDGNYKPSNCRFTTWKIQQRNSRSNRFVKIGNKTKLLVEWAEEAGIRYDTLRYRIENSWPEHRLLEPIRK